jgi:hypothetical protein
MNQRRGVRVPDSFPLSHTRFGDDAAKIYFSAGDGNWLVTRDQHFITRPAPVPFADLCEQACGRGELRLFRWTTDLWRVANDEHLSDFARRCAREQAELVEEEVAAPLRPVVTRASLVSLPGFKEALQRSGKPCLRERAFRVYQRTLDGTSTSPASAPVQATASLPVPPGPSQDADWHTVRFDDRIACPVETTAPHVVDEEGEDSDDDGDVVVVVGIEKHRVWRGAIPGGLYQVGVVPAFSDGVVFDGFVPAELLAGTSALITYAKTEQGAELQQYLPRRGQPTRAPQQARRGGPMVRRLDDCVLALE